MIKSNEPKITINGFELSNGQAMALRVALNDFQLSMVDENALGSDEVGRAIRKGYSDRLAEVAKFMMAHTKSSVGCKIDAPYVKGSETSKAAAKKVKEDDWARVLQYIKSRGTYGTTDYEIEQALNLRHQTASARRRGLQLKNLVTLTDETRPTDTGRQAGVYVHSDFV